VPVFFVIYVRNDIVVRLRSIQQAKFRTMTRLPLNHERTSISHPTVHIFAHSIRPLFRAEDHRTHEAMEFVLDCYAYMSDRTGNHRNAGWKGAATHAREWSLQGSGQARFI
jgi:hypothetical protein